MPGRDYSLSSSRFPFGCRLPLGRRLLFCAGFGVWALFFDAAEQAGPGVKAFGVASLIASLVLAIYGVYFYRKSKSIIV